MGAGDQAGGGDPRFNAQSGMRAFYLYQTVIIRQFLANAGDAGELVFCKNKKGCSIKRAPLIGQSGINSDPAELTTEQHRVREKSVVTWSHL